MLEQICICYHGFSPFGRQYYPPMSADIVIYLYLISISTEPNDLPTSVLFLICLELFKIIICYNLQRIFTIVRVHEAMGNHARLYAM